MAQPNMREFGQFHILQVFVECTFGAAHLAPEDAFSKCSKFVWVMQR